MNAHGTSPHFSSDFATTAAIETAGCLARVFSISIDEIFSPPEIIISFDLSCILYIHQDALLPNLQNGTNHLPWLFL